MSKIKERMTKSRFNLRNVVAIAICLAGTVMFSGCGKDDTEPKDPPKNPLTYDEGVVINGVKWATRNVDEVGTFALTPESAGKFYQWNRKKAWNTTDSIVSGWDSTNPEGTKWEKAKDPSPTGWRVPTFEEIEKLLDTNRVTNEWTTENGVIGVKFVDKTTGSVLFLSAAGYRDKVTSGISQHASGYWSDTPHESDEKAYVLGFLTNDRVYLPETFRSYGFSVRSVAE